MTNKEILEKYQIKIRENYSGVVSEEVIQLTIDWWTKITLEALELKDAQHKAEMIELIESLKTEEEAQFESVTATFSLPLTTESVMRWKAEQLTKLKND